MKQVIIDGIEYVPKEIEKPEQPKPLLANAKEGWLCELRNHKWTKIVKVHGNSAFEYQNPETNAPSLFTCDENGDTSKWGKIPEVDIIHAEPIAEEGSAEWAWQMVMLDIKMWHPAEQSMECTALTKEKFVRAHAKTGWKLYEPKPIPNGYYAVSTVDPIPIVLERCNGKWLYPDGTLREFESVADIVGYVPAEKPAEQPKPKFANVQKGDYVLLKNGFIQKVAKIECIPNEHDIVLDTLNNQFGGYYWFSGKPVCRNHSCITRILSPSEVVVKIGSMSGTVRRLNDIFFALNPSKEVGWVVPEATIPYEMLDPATAEIVRELIAKQKGENNG